MAASTSPTTSIATPTYWPIVRIRTRDGLDGISVLVTGWPCEHYGQAPWAPESAFLLRARCPNIRLILTRLAIAAIVLAQLGTAALLLTNSPLLLLASALWLASLVLAVAVAVRATWPDATPRGLIEGWHGRLVVSRAEQVGIGLVLVAGAALRFVDLDGFPSGIHGDEAEFGVIAISVLHGNGPNPFGTAFLGDPALFTWIEAPFVQVFGTTITAVRSLAALSGTLTLIPFYALTRWMFGPLAAVLGTAFLAGAAVAIHFSRLALNVPEVLLLASLSIACLWRGYLSRGLAWWLFSGMAAGMAFYFHFTGRLVPVAIAAFMVYLLATRRTAVRVWIRQVASLCAGSVLVLMPMAMYLASRSSQFVEHMDSRLIFQDWGRIASQQGTTDPLPILWEQLVTNLAAFATRQDASQFYTFAAAPMLNGLTAGIFVLGLALMLVRLRDPRFALLCIWFWTFVILGGVLTLDSPQFHRLLPALLPALIGVAAALDWIVRTSRSLFGPKMASVLSGVALLLPLASAAYDANAYFGADARAYPWADTTAQARYIAALGSGYQVLVAGMPYTYASHGVTRYLAGDVGARDLANPPVQLGQGPLDRPLAVLINPALQSWLPTLESVYPAGQATPVQLPDGRILFTAFVVPAAGPPSGWPSGHGLAGQLRANDPGAPVRPFASPIVAFRDVSALVPDGAPPFAGQWRGGLSVAQAGSYVLELWTDGAASLTLDDQPVVGKVGPSGEPRFLVGQVSLTPGVHQIQIDDQFPRIPGMLELYWQPPGGPLALVPAENLVPAK